jgi:hypothetical protein
MTANDVKVCYVLLLYHFLFKILKFQNIQEYPAVHPSKTPKDNG